MAELLPDSRCRDPKGIIFGKDGNHWVPIFCANCGHPGGAVPEQNMTFAFYLCNACVETFGPIAATRMVPDEVYWAEIAAEQVARAKEDDHAVRV